MDKDKPITLKSVKRDLRAIFGKRTHSQKPTSIGGDGFKGKGEFTTEKCGQAQKAYMDAMKHR